MSVAPAVSERHRQQRRVILEAAARFIAAHGYHGMSMRALAQATGMGVSSLYNYFPSKEDILAALQCEAFESLIASTTAALAGVEPPAARLYVFISRHVQHFGEHPEVMRVLVHEAGSLPPPARRAVRRLKERYFEIGRDCVRRVVEEGCGAAAPGEAAGDAAALERTTYSVFGMLNWIYGWYRPAEHGSPRELSRTIHRIALCGLVAHCPFRGLQESMEAHLAGQTAPPLLGDEATEVAP